MNLLTQANSGLRVAVGQKIHAPFPEGDTAQLFDAASRLLSNLSPG